MAKAAKRIVGALTLCGLLLQAGLQAASAQEFEEHFSAPPNGQSTEQIFENVEAQTLQNLQNDVVEASAFGARADIDFTPFGQASNIEQFNLNFGQDESDKVTDNTCHPEQVGSIDVDGCLDEVTHDLASADFEDEVEEDRKGGSARFRAPRRGRPNVKGSGVPPSVKRKIEKFDLGKIPASHNSAVLKTADEDSVMETSLASVRTSKGSAVLVIDMDGEVAVFNLHDRSRKGVIIAVDHREFALSPGRQLVLRTDEAKPRFLSVTHAKQFKLNHCTAYAADFSIAGLIKGAPALRRVALDKRHNHTIDEVLKTAVIIQMMRRSKEKRS